jgi:hypothetical protein
MQNDIIPPNLRRTNTNTPKNQPMHSLRLMGHSVEDAKKRLLGAEKANIPAAKPEKKLKRLLPWVVKAQVGVNRMNGSSTT